MVYNVQCEVYDIQIIPSGYMYKQIGRKRADDLVMVRRPGAGQLRVDVALVALSPLKESVSVSCRRVIRGI
jgi:hypothetical protein